MKSIWNRTKDTTEAFVDFKLMGDPSQLEYNIQSKSLDSMEKKAKLLKNQFEKLYEACNSSSLHLSALYLNLSQSPGQISRQTNDLTPNERILDDLFREIFKEIRNCRSLVDKLKRETFRAAINQKEHNRIRKEEDQEFILHEKTKQFLKSESYKRAYDESIKGYTKTCEKWKNISNQLYSLFLEETKKIIIHMTSTEHYDNVESDSGKVYPSLDALQ